MSDVDNVIAIEAWNTVLFDKFCRFRYVLTEGRIEFCVCPSLLGRLPAVDPAERSALLLPPDKPPTV